MDISIFIPVYKESEQVPSILDKLGSQDVEKEIFVTVDEPSEGFLEKTKRFSGVEFIVNAERVGKARALNDAVKLSSGKVLLFLDADIELPDDPDFLKKIILEMQYVDVLDIKKRVERNSFLSKMAYYEYFTFNVSAWIASEYMRRCPAANGAAFAMKRVAFEKVNGFRSVVSEDLDLTTRAFLADQSFAYTMDVEVKNLVHSNWGTWFRQRRRWAIGQALWTKEWYRELLKHCVKKPQIFLPGLFFLYPSVILVFLNLSLPSSWAYDMFWTASLFMSVKLNFALPVFLVSLFSADLVKSLLISLASFGITAALFFGFSRKLGFKMKIHELFVYYFFYSLLWMVIMIIGYVQVFVFGKKTAPNWKV